MDVRNITLISFGYWDAGFLQTLLNNVSRVFRAQVHLKDGHLDVSDFYDAARRQYNANDLLKHIEMAYATSDTKTLAMFNVDLFIPIFTYIFGQAFLNGNSGIVSDYRLHNERYGMLADNDLMWQRLTKEIIHELGHTFGLIHCHEPYCVMQSGNYVEDIDQKNAGFCEKCKDFLF